MRTRLFLVLAASGLCTFGAPPAAADEARLVRYGQHLARECNACHRPDSVDKAIPSLGGWDAEHFITTLRFYQTGQRNNPVMVSVARSLDEEQLAALAAYYASLPKPAPPR